MIFPMRLVLSDAAPREGDGAMLGVVLDIGPDRILVTIDDGSGRSIAIEQVDGLPRALAWNGTSESPVTVSVPKVEPIAVETRDHHENRIVGDDAPAPN